MPEGFKASVSMGTGRDGRGKPKKRFEKRITLDSVIDWINQQNYDEYTKRELIKKVSAYPYNSFKYFFSNVNKHIIKIREEKERLRKEKDERERISANREVDFSGEIVAKPVPNEQRSVSTTGLQGSNHLSSEGKEESAGEPAASSLSS